MGRGLRRTKPLPLPFIRILKNKTSKTKLGGVGSEVELTEPVLIRIGHCI